MTKVLLYIVCWFFIKSINRHIKIRPSSTTCFGLDEDTLFLNVLDIDECGFLKHMSEEHFCHCTYDYDILLWIILHEIGHCETQYFLSDSEEDYGYRDLCQRIEFDLLTQNEALQRLYYNLSSEYEATEWAISYEYEHQDKCHIFSKIIEIIRGDNK